MSEECDDEEDISIDSREMNRYNDNYNENFARKCSVPTRYTFL